MTPRQLHTLFMERQRSRHLKPATLDWYDDILPRLVRVLPDKPQTRDLQAWLGMAPSAGTANNWLRAARAMYHWGALEYPKKVHDITALASAPNKPRPPRIFTPAELRLIFAAAKRLGKREFAMVMALLDTGIRVGELTSIRTERMHQEQAVDPKTGELVTLTVLTVEGKTGEREVPASADTVAALMAIAPPVGRVFRAVKGPDRPSPVTSVKDRVRDVVTIAGLSGQKLGPHTFRHTFATNYLRAGGDIYRLQRLLGHSNIRQTMVYLTLASGDAFAEHQRLTPLHLIRGAV